MGIISVHVGSVRQTASILYMSSELLRTGDKAIVRFRFIKNPEYLRVGMRMVFREGRTKAVGNITKLYPHISAVAQNTRQQRAHKKDHQHRPQKEASVDPAPHPPAPPCWGQLRKSFFRDSWEFFFLIVPPVSFFLSPKLVIFFQLPKAGRSAGRSAGRNYCFDRPHFLIVLIVFIFLLLSRQERSNHWQGFL